MAPELMVHAGDKEYPVLVGRGIYDQALPDIIRPLKPGRVIVVSHASLREIYGERLEEALGKGLRAKSHIEWFVIPEGEKSKNLTTVEEGYRFFLQKGVTRDDLVVAFGGGVVGDLAGFLSATYMRGIRYLQVPTTVMAMVDSSIGGKTGVDLPEGKNAVGAFHHPEAVVSDIAVLDTLPDREIRSGLVEVAKYGFLYDPDILEEMEIWPDGRPPQGYDLTFLIRRCAEHKARAVEEDERDLKGARAMLNYGHTFGHALEAAAGYRLLRHGEAVALGMIMASRLAEWSGLARVPLEERHLGVLLPLLQEIEHPLSLSPREVLRFMEVDKKRGRGLRFVLLRDWQSPVLVESPPGKLVEKVVGETLKDLDRWTGLR
ncbi:MAG: 3-dehydroquinate synthase [Actinomycetota bacterium]